MSCLSWKYKGLGGLWIVRALDNYIRRYRPKLNFLMKTRMRDHGIDSLRRKFDYFGLCVASIGFSGGLALLGIRRLMFVVKVSQKLKLTLMDN